jgi:hypothetical protein
LIGHSFFVYMNTVGPAVGINPHIERMNTKSIYVCCLMCRHVIYFVWSIHLLLPLTSLSIVKLVLARLVDELFLFSFTSYFAQIDFSICLSASSLSGTDKREWKSEKKTFFYTCILVLLSFIRKQMMITITDEGLKELD